MGPKAHGKKKKVYGPGIMALFFKPASLYSSQETMAAIIPSECIFLLLLYQMMEGKFNWLTDYYLEWWVDDVCCFGLKMPGSRDKGHRYVGGVMRQVTTFNKRGDRAFDMLFKSQSFRLVISWLSSHLVDAAPYQTRAHTLSCYSWL